MTNELTWEQQQDNAAYEQWKAEEDWKKYDTQDHEAGAAYYDQLASKPQAAAPKPQRTIIMEAQNHHLALAQRHLDDYERRIYRAAYAGDLVDIAAQQADEDRAYKLCLLNASLAQAEALARIAEALTQVAAGPAETTMSRAAFIAMQADAGYRMVGE